MLLALDEEDDEAPAERELSPALVAQFLENQSRELALRNEELALKQRELEVNYQYAERALEAQVRDRKDSRQEIRSERRDTLVFLGMIASLVACFFGWLLYNGKDAFALEVLKAVLYLGGGGAGGYFAGKSKGREQAKATE
jgi:hypothetical protein